MSKTSTTDKQQTAFTTDSVVSKDGTRIMYRQLGQGPGVVLLHGSMESAASHMILAEGLADSFTVYLPERRGHDITAAKAHPYSMQKELEDLQALLTKTGAHDVFGVSAGGLVALQAAMKLSGVQKVALYEPALIVNKSASTEFLAQFDQEIANGDIAGAMVTSMIGAQLGPDFMSKIPRGLLNWITKLSLKSDDKKARPGTVTMRMLAPTIHYDFVLVGEMAETLDQYKTMPATVDILLMSGGKSPKWLRGAVDELIQVLPQAQHVHYPSLDHGGSSDISGTNRDGKPALVVPDLRTFFSA